jgi:hypothetical protein
VISSRERPSARRATICFVTVRTIAAACVVLADLLCSRSQVSEEAPYRGGLGAGPERRCPRSPCAHEPLLRPVVFRAERVRLFLQDARGDELLEREVEQTLLLRLASSYSIH